MRPIFGLTLFVVAMAPQALAFESAKVLPPGVRNLDLRSVQTTIEEKTDGSGTAQPLAQPLSQDLTFSKIAKDEDPLKSTQLKAFLLSNGFAETDSVGQFKGDLNGSLAVFAPIASYGLTDKLTLAIAAPYYRAATSIKVGFTPNATAQRFLNQLALTENNQTAAAREAGEKMNAAVARLNTKLVDHGFAELKDWNDSGFGDITVAAKVRALDAGFLALATTGGVVLPTGRADDPNILNDMPFGDGQWDVFGQVAIDEPLVGGLFLNQHVKFTEQLPGKKDVRLIDADEKIAVGDDKAKFKLGDKWDAGASLQYEANFGLVAGAGYTYFRKYGDVYRDVPGPTKSELEKGTDQVAHNSEAVLGYSTIPAYQRGTFVAPLELKLTYTNQLASRNLPVTDLVQLDFNLFF